MTVTRELRAALIELARTAADRRDTELFDFAVATIAATTDPEALAPLADLAVRSGAFASRLVLTIDGLARRIATAEVLDRLPDGLDAVAADFARRFTTRAS